VCGMCPKVECPGMANLMPAHSEQGRLLVPSPLTRSPIKPACVRRTLADSPPLRLSRINNQAGANQALEQTRDSVLRYGESVGCELLNYFVRSWGRIIAQTPTLGTLETIRAHHELLGCHVVQAASVARLVSLNRPSKLSQHRYSTLLVDAFHLRPVSIPVARRPINTGSVLGIVPEVPRIRRILKGVFLARSPDRKPHIVLAAAAMILWHVGNGIQAERTKRWSRLRSRVRRCSRVVHAKLLNFSVRSLEAQSQSQSQSS